MGINDGFGSDDYEEVQEMYWDMSFGDWVGERIVSDRLWDERNG